MRITNEIMDFFLEERTAAATAMQSDWDRLLWLATNYDRAPTRAALKDAFDDAGHGKLVTYYKHKRMLELAISRGVKIPKLDELKYDFG